MAYNEVLADRIREQMSDQSGLSEKRMFGGLAFLINGHMAAAAGSNGSMMLRIDPDDTDLLVAEPHAARVRMQGHELDGWLSIDLVGLETEDALGRWLAHGIAYTRALPAKK